MSSSSAFLYLINCDSVANTLDQHLAKLEKLLEGFISFLFNEIILELYHKSLKRKMQIFAFQMLTFVGHISKVDK